MALRALIVGGGNRGRDWARELARHPAWDIAGIAEVDERTRRTLASEFGDEPGYFASIAQGLDAGDIDGVIVATPADAHAEPCAFALSRKVPVLVEKPFTTSLHDAVRLVELADGEGVPLLVAQNYRYMRAHRTVKQVIDAGRLGDINLIRAAYYRVPHEMPHWLKSNPHSVMWGMAVHHLDALRYVLGRKVTNVFARHFTSSWNDVAPGATYDVLLDFENGTRATYSATYESSGHEYFEAGQEFYERFVGTSGTLHVVHRWLVLCPRGGFPRIIRRGKRDRTEEHLLLTKFSDAIHGASDIDCDGRDNLETMAIVQACIDSSETGCWVDPRALLSSHGA